MNLETFDTLPDPDGRWWDLYRRAFEDVAKDAVQQHLMTRPEFTAVLTDPRLLKYAITDPERARYACLATMTSDLEAVPLISPAYFEQHWPEYFASGRIRYNSFVAVDPDYQGTGAMSMFIERIYQESLVTGGLFCLDIATSRNAGIRLEDAIERLARSHRGDVRRHRLDAQVYWGYEVPTPA